MVAVVDYGTGNLCSVADALGRLGAEYVVTSDAGVIASADRVILPGVGAAYRAMGKLRERGLDEVIKMLRRPVLGICIGMQLMTRRSDEGDCYCMGIFDTDTLLLSPGELKVPHMGWDTIEELRSPMFKGVDDGAWVYYVHSYAPGLCGDTVATTDYGGRFSAALACDNFFGTQFHPEKSGGIGTDILRNFMDV